MISDLVVRRHPRNSAPVPSLILCAVLVFPAQVTGQSQGGLQGREWSAEEVIKQERFAAPPDAIAEAVLAPRYLNVTLTNPSPDKRWFLNEIGDGPVTMDVFSKPFHELGGVFVDYAANRSRTLTTRNNVGIELISAEDGSTVRVEVPGGARVSNATWSPDGRRLAFFAHFDDATHIFVADPASGRSRQLTRTPVLASLYTGFSWSGDGERIATVLVPSGRSLMPVMPSVPVGPQVKVTEDAENRLRTYASLMATPHDQELLEWHATGQVALIDVDSRRATHVGPPTMVRSLDLSPDGQYLRVTRMTKPFSYVVPVDDFGSVEEVWDASGTVFATVDVDSLDTGVWDPDQPQPQPGQFGQGRQSGRREVAWRLDGQGLTFLEQEPALEGEDTASARNPARGQEESPAGQRSRREDRVMQWLPPFDSANLVVVYENNARVSNHHFSPDHEILFLTERNGQNTHEFAVDLSDPETKHTLARYESDDFYANPGSLLMTRGPIPSGRGSRRFRFGGGGAGGGTVQLSADGEHVFYVGSEYDPNPMEVGPKSFIDKVGIQSGGRDRIYESENDGRYERITAVLDIDMVRLVVSRETPTEVPQSYLRAGDQLTLLTENTNYTPDLTHAPRERFVVERPDGFKFLVNVILPPEHRSGTRLPAMFWFYPREYTDQEDYDEGARTFNKNSFPNFGTRSMQYLIRLGYAVVEPDAPIVGPEGQMNNNYEHDLRNNLAAVIDELDRREIIDRDRLGIGGHSYGSFSTANAMVHTPFFKAGIAGDGNFNRTLTPLSFQNERRILWEAREVYLSMSPFLYANNLTGALLIYHGLHDQNEGTAPEHAPRMFHALNGLGKTAAMYLYPFEDHGPATRETLLDLWARWTAWLDIYVKNAGREGEPPVTEDSPSRSR